MEFDGGVMRENATAGGRDLNERVEGCCLRQEHVGLWTRQFVRVMEGID